MNKPKYTDKLLKPITPGLIKLAQHGSFEKWLKSDQVKQEYFNRMFDLLKHYHIDPSLPERWFILAVELASDHVKGFSVAPTYKGRGRPKKKENRAPKTKRRPGRPLKHTLEDATELVYIVDGYKQQLVREKKRNVTDIETLKNLITSYAKSEKKSVAKTLSIDLPYFQKQLSESRKKIRENT